MAISGRKDEDDSKKASLEKARENGFGQPGVAGRKPYNANESFEELAKERLPNLVKKSFDALERALDSSNQNTALAAFDKLHKNYYNPDKKIIVEGPSHNEIQNNILVLQDGMNPKELEVMNAFQDLLREGLRSEEKEAAIIDVEAVDVLNELDELEG